MKAIIITESGGPEVLKIQERPEPLPLAGEVLIKVMAAGINRPDIYQRKGKYPPPSGVPADIPGLEVAGTVIKTGAQSRWKSGDPVCALISGGGYAEYCVAPESQCLPVPENLSFAGAASLPETFFTVWSNVFDRAKLKAGDDFLVHGGSSGIGVAAIQLAKQMGARIFTTAGTDEKCSFCEELGASAAINYNNNDFKELILDKTKGNGVDVILDMIGGSYTASNLEILKPEGRLVYINAMKGSQVNINLSLIMQKRLTLTGSTLRARDEAFKGAIARQLEEKVWPLLKSEKIKPIVYKTFPFEQVSEAHHLMESSAHLGKIILTFD
jgi:NADPH2:quinone reductase